MKELEMTLPNIFTVDVSENIIKRINTLKSNTAANWGKMNAPQMLAHCNVMYEMVYDNQHPEPNIFMKFIMKTFVKKIVVSDTPYKHNAQTAPAFMITASRNFELEKNRLIDYILKTQHLGMSNFDNKRSDAFGELSKVEWNNMFYKHLDHHLMQFGV